MQAAVTGQTAFGVQNEGLPDWRLAVAPKGIESETATGRIGQRLQRVGQKDIRNVIDRQNLIQAANEAGGPDNISVIIIQIPEISEPA